MEQICKLEYYNMAGQLVKTLTYFNEMRAALIRNTFPGLINPGVYVLRMFYKDKTTRSVKRFLR